MIMTIIVVSSIVLAVAFTVAWLALPGLRRRIEAPKHLFTEQIRQYDQQNTEIDTTAGAHPNDGS